MGKKVTLPTKSGNYGTNAGGNSGTTRPPRPLPGGKQKGQ